MASVKSVILGITLIVLAVFSMPTPSHAAFRFLILPFDMYSGEDISDLRREVMNIVASSFEEEGAEVVGIEEVKSLMLEEGIRSFDEERAIAIGRRTGADFAVLGAITRLDGTASIDLQVFDIYIKRNLAFFFKKGDDRMMLLEDLSSLVATAYNSTVAEAGKRPVNRTGNIDDIAFIGNHRVDKEAITRRIKSKVGEPFSMDDIRGDIKSIFGMGYFDDVRAELIDAAAGKKLTFVVSERPFIKKVEIVGNDKLTKEKIEGIVTVKENTILDRVLLKENVEKIKALYESEGYYLAEARHKVKVEELGVAVTFEIEEGKQVRVRRIAIIGNDSFSDKDVRKVMGTKELGIFSFLTGSGKFNEFIFLNDLDSIMALYYDNGYINAEITDHRALLSEDKRWFYITVALKEGEQYLIGNVDIKGDILTTKEELMKNLKLSPDDIFSRRKLFVDIGRLRDIYGDKGYAKADISPLTTLDDEKKKTVDITLDIKKGPLVYIERIDIDGNTRTRDKVIRREIEVEEGMLYSSTGIKRSRNKLRRLGYFDDVVITQSEGSSEDKMSLNVRVKERPTGQISAGFGYSSVDKLIGTASISQNNLAGTGIKLDLSGTFSATSERYQIGLTQPWLMDKPISAGFDIFKSGREYPDFTRNSTGFDLRLGFPVYWWRDTRAFISYKDEDVDVTDVSDTASSSIKDQEGESKTRSLSGLIKRDTRDDAFFPTEGSIVSLSVEYAGGLLGGDNNFLKYVTNAIKFFPLPLNTTISLRGELGYIYDFYNTPIPIYERFFLGGINSIRGFRSREVGPKDPITGEVIGGTKELIFNVEFIFPLVSEQRIKGLLFFDVGNAYDDKIDLGDLRKSAGLGVRWFSPIGPLRLEWGFNLNRRGDEKGSQFEFSIGTPF
ncbi:MAG: outer membrane protein assembly factor BamA [Thermodesulfobacteriota bacterium]